MAKRIQYQRCPECREIANLRLVTEVPDDNEWKGIAVNLFCPSCGWEGGGFAVDEVHIIRNRGLDAGLDLEIIDGYRA